MNNQNEYGMTIRDAVDSVLRHRKLAVRIFLAVMALAIALVFLWPPSYRSEGKLYVRATAKHLSEDPTVTKDQMISVAPPAEQDVNSIVEILLSREMAQRVVTRIGVEKLLDIQTTGTTYNVESIPRTRKGQKAISRVMDNLRISTPEKTTIIDVSYDANSPEIARQVVDIVMKEYLAEHISVNQTDGSYDFFKTQAEKLSKELDDSSDRLKSLKNELGLATIDGKRKMLEQQIADLESAKISTIRELSTAAARIESLKSKMDNLSRMTTLSEISGYANTARDNMRNELYKLQANEENLLAQYTAKHPFVKAARQQVERLKEILAEQSEERTQVETGANPTYQKLEADYLAEQALFDALTAQNATLVAQHQEVLGELKRLNSYELDILQLEREVAQAETSYHNYLERLEQARMHDELEGSRISNVQIVQDATYVSKPVAPKKGLILALAMIAAAGASLGFCLLKDSLVPSPTEASATASAEFNFEVPILSTLPNMRDATAVPTHSP